MVACVNTSAVRLGILHSTAYRLLRSTWVAMHPVHFDPRTVSLSQWPIVLRLSADLGRSWMEYSMSKCPHLLFFLPPWRNLPLIRSFLQSFSSRRPASSAL